MGRGIQKSSKIDSRYDRREDDVLASGVLRQIPRHNALGLFGISLFVRPQPAKFIKHTKFLLCDHNVFPHVLSTTQPPL